MFTTEFKAEIDESESATLNHYYREAMTQGYNFAFEVKDWKKWKSVADAVSQFLLPHAFYFKYINALTLRSTATYSTVQRL